MRRKSPMFQRRHYEATAKVFRKQYDESKHWADPNGGANTAIIGLVYQFALMYSRDSERFDIGRFIQASTGYDADRVISFRMAMWRDKQLEEEGKN